MNRADPPIDLSVIDMPGCSAHMVDWFGATLLPPGPSAQVAETVANDPTLIGVVLVGQSITYSPPLTPFGLITSNGVVLTHGL